MPKEYYSPLVHPALRLGRERTAAMARIEQITGMVAYEAELIAGATCLTCQLGVIAKSETRTLPPAAVKESYPVTVNTGSLFHLKFCGRTWADVEQAWRASN